MSREPWDDWKAAWQDAPSVDVERLRRYVDGKRLRLRWFVIAEMLVSLLVLAHLAWRYATVSDGALRSLILCGVVLVVGGQILMLVLRRGTWRSRGASPTELLRLTIRRCTVGIRLILAQWIGTGACFVVFAAWFALEWSPLEDALGTERLLFVVKANVIAQIPVLLAFAAWTAWYLPRLRRRRASAQNLLAALDNA
jgi:hypothetical protein